MQQYEAMLKAQAPLDAIIKVEETDAQVTELPYVEPVGPLELIKGNIARTTLPAKKPLIEIRNYGLAVQIDEGAFRFDKLQQYRTQIMGLATQAALFASEQTAGLLAEAETYLIPLDNLPLISNPQGERVNDNFIAGTGTTIDKLKADLVTVNGIMKTAKTANGRYLNIQPNIIVCPPATEAQFREILTSVSGIGVDANANTANVFGAWYSTVISRPEIPPGNWFAIHASEVAKPFAFYKNGEPTFELDESEAVQASRYTWAAKLWGEVEATWPQLICMVKN
jgi:hypothetical protein